MPAAATHARSVAPQADGSLQRQAARAHGRTRSVVAIIPCYNRPDDAAALLNDLAALTADDAGTGLDLSALLVDNASDQPLGGIAIPHGLALKHIRLESNTGGSGGFNAGLRQALALERSADASLDYLWLVDSDARVAPDTLAALARVLESDRTVVAAGAAIHDPATGRCFELGGAIDRRTGSLAPAVAGSVGIHSIVECDYVASCCALVRADAARAAGLFPDRFINADDAEWFVRLGQVTGGRVVAVPWARAWHPRFDRFPTWQRYYTTRNALAPLAALGLGRRVRFRRAMQDVRRAAYLELTQRPDLAALHLAGLRDAAAGRITGPAPDGVIRVDPPRPLAALMETLRAEIGDLRGRRVVIALRAFETKNDRALVESALRRQDCEVRPIGVDRSMSSVAGLARRLFLGPAADVAVVPARSVPSEWGRGRWVVQVFGATFVLRRARPADCTFRAAAIFVSAVPPAIAASRRAFLGPSALDTAYAAAATTPPFSVAGAMSVEAIVLSYNRWNALSRTLAQLQEDPVFARAADPASPPRTITVVDNASTDGTPDHLRAAFPHIKILNIETNLGVEAFNRAAAQSFADALLILDDDAVPDRHALTIALDRLARNPTLGAVTLHPRHPRTGRSEWPFARERTARWPVMGCANLVRTAAWRASGGYDAGLFLYRNDTDLALRLLSIGWGVHFDPALIAWHDTAGGAGGAKSLNWHRTATRNWLWLARRHGRGFYGVLGGAMGWAWSHKLAGTHIKSHLATFRGALDGLLTQPPPFGTKSDGRAWAELIRLRLGKPLSPDN